MRALLKLVVGLAWLDLAVFYFVATAIGFSHGSSFCVLYLAWLDCTLLPLLMAAMVAAMVALAMPFALAMPIALAMHVVQVVMAVVLAECHARP